jgi:SAM-dependent methyltransferase
MNHPPLQVQIESADAYEALFVPALFGPWASRVADAAGLRPGQRVLDVACGTGALGREAAARVGPNGSVAGLDPSAGMLEVAKRLSPEAEWRQGVAESLPFPDRSFDVVVSQFGLMFFDDRLQALREMVRVLAPAGRLAVAVWDSLENNPAYAAEVALLERVAGREAADALRAPFVLGNRDGLAALATEAGIGSVEVITERMPAHFPSVRIMVEADLRGWLPVMGVVLQEQQIARVLSEAEHAMSPFVASDGTFETSAHIIRGAKLG